ncbi:5-oxoprolinase subunit PxpB [Reichenbachiella versicolor]|uniref:5-oxoprolinase subunit PxpB n=1 Tax=Reichenbachiella versicolor TaxID=1821036 RepID=UPI000D6E4CFA|nr:5-oxoprolinase subunit PxpB [Reichenbachiella versicolor]
MLSDYFDIKIKRFGSRAILLEWPDLISENTLFEIKTVEHLIKGDFNDEIIDTVETYNSLTVFPDVNKHSLDVWIKRITSLALRSESFIDSKLSKVWQVPVCYDEEFGIDLKQMSISLKIPIEEIVELHSMPEYLVYFIGFLPGFLYLGGLDERLYYPRKSIPRAKIAKGSIAIGGRQTGIYPNVSPAGWSIIGRSPVNFFEIGQSQPTFAVSGDKVKFIPVSKKGYDCIHSEVVSRKYIIKHE